MGIDVLKHGWLLRVPWLRDLRFGKHSRFPPSAQMIANLTFSKEIAHRHLHQYPTRNFSNLVRHYAYAAFVIISLLSLGCTYTTQKDVTVL